MNKEQIINRIEDPNTWNAAKHRYAEKLLDEFDSKDVRSYLWDKFCKTKDYFYCSILKTK